MDHHPHQDIIAAPGQADFEEAPPPYSAREEPFMTCHSTCCGHFEDSDEPHILWKMLQTRGTLPDIVVIETRLPCWHCALSWTEDIKSWLESLEGRGNDDDDKRILVAELAWVAAYLEANPKLSDTEENLARMGAEIRRLGRLGAYLVDAVKDAYGRTSASHMALFRGLRYWSLRSTHGMVRREYLTMLDMELNNLARVRAEHDRLLDRGEAEGGTFLISLRELNRLYYALVEVYEAIAQIAAVVATTHGDLYPYYQPYVTYQRFLYVKRDLREQCDLYKKLSQDVQRDVETFRDSLPIRELVDPVPMPSRNDSRIEFIKKIEESITLITLETGELWDSVDEAEEAPYPRASRRFDWLPCQEGIMELDDAL
ncbi:hypothetical protein PG993_008609 [Apiospora rasikravindrae]|uniref:Uncharacterized protein n=1 Tax=Apiospora rasikravindrae TaxID=990691 RepID=A0ABR1T0U9_9PEZI